MGSFETALVALAALLILGWLAGRRFGPASQVDDVDDELD